MTRLVAFVTIILLVSGLVIPQKLQDFIDCWNVLVYFSTCLAFINGRMGEPTFKCCAGVHELNKLANQNHGAQKICHCIELISGKEEPPFLLANINDLPIKCNTHLSFPISVNKDCSKVTVNSRSRLQHGADKMD